MEFVAIWTAFLPQTMSRNRPYITNDISIEAGNAQRKHKQKLTTTTRPQTIRCQQFRLRRGQRIDDDLVARTPRSV